MDNQRKRQKSTRKGGWIQSLRSLFVLACLVLLVGTILAPTPAYASCRPCGCVCPGDIIYDAVQDAGRKIKDLKSAISNATENSAFIKWGVELFKFFSTTLKGLTGWFDIQKLQNTAIVKSKMINAGIETKTTDAKIKAATEDTAGGMAMEAAAAQGDRSAADQYLCNVVKVRMALHAMQEFADSITDIITKGIDASGRGPGDTGDAVQAATDNRRFECGEAGKYDIPTGNRSDIVEEKCRAESSDPRVGTVNMRSSATTLADDRVYTLPDVEDQNITENGVNYKVGKLAPDPDDESQRLFMQAQLYCYSFNGNHPAPPHGAQIETTKGLAKSSQSAECRSKQSEFVAACGARLAKLTKPNCANKDMAPFCEAAQDACHAAKQANLSLGPEYNNCENGLNLYQMQRVSVLMCGATRSLQADGISGATESDKTATVQLCAQMKDYWDELNRIERATFMAALKGVMRNRECFVGSGR